MQKTAKLFVGIVLIAVLFILLGYYFIQSEKSIKNPQTTLIPTTTPFSNHPLSITNQRNKSYPGSEIAIEQNLPDGINYKQYVTSYKSDGLTIYALLSIPKDPPPKGGYPAIIFNHGYIPPEEYRTTERYTSYFDGFARQGYIVFKPDYRGHGNSQGSPTGAYFSSGYLEDVLNAAASVKKIDNANPKKIGMWGHSLGGFLTLRAMVVSDDIKAGVIWGGVVGSYQDMFEQWWSKRNRSPWSPSAREQQANRPSRQSFVNQYGEPSDASPFWKAISTTTYAKEISGPIQLHHGSLDETVPPILSQKLYQTLTKEGKIVEYYEYEGSDHNISQEFSQAMQRSVDFFDKYLK